MVTQKGQNVSTPAHPSKPKSPVDHSGRIIAACSLLGVAGLAACARSTAEPPKYPSSQNVLCHYIGLESIESPQHTDQDSLSLVAVYRFSEPKRPAPEQRVTLNFRVNRSRVDELRSHLESHPDVICAPDRSAHYHVQVRPLEPLPAGARPALGGESPPEL